MKIAYHNNDLLRKHIFSAAAAATSSAQQSLPDVVAVAVAVAVVYE